MTDSPTITQKAAENAAAGVAGLKELAMLDDGTLADLERIEQEIFFRQFYFPGGPAVLRLPGLGTDVPGKYKYDQIPGEKYMLDDWDPRYIPQYIQQANQQGFHRHFLYFNGSSVETISYDDAADKLYYAIEGRGFRESDSKVVYGILSGLLYMNKMKTFCDEFKGKLGKTKADLEQHAMLGRDLVSIADQQLKKVIGQSKDTFIKQDNGWYTRDMKYAFDVEKYAREWEQKQVIYQEYKNKIWEILKNVQNLNLCTNNTSGINIGNVSIKQETECLMKIQNDTNIIDQTPAAPAAQAPAPAPVQQPVQQAPAPVQTPAPAPVVQQPVVQQSVQQAPKQSQQSATKTQKVVQEVEEEEEQSSSSTVIIVIALLVIVGIAVGTYFIINNMKAKQAIRSTYSNTLTPVAPLPVQQPIVNTVAAVPVQQPTSVVVIQK